MRPQTFSRSQSRTADERFLRDPRPPFAPGFASSSGPVGEPAVFLSRLGDPNGMKGHYCSGLSQKLKVIVPVARQPLQQLQTTQYRGMPGRPEETESLNILSRHSPAQDERHFISLTHSLSRTSGGFGPKSIGHPFFYRRTSRNPDDHNPRSGISTG